MKTNTVPNRAFEDTPVLGCLTMYQLMAVALTFLLFAIPFMRGVSVTSVVFLLIGAGVMLAEYLFFEGRNESKVGKFNIWWNETISSRPVKSCGLKCVDRSVQKRKKLITSQTQWYFERKNEIVDVVDFKGKHNGGTDVLIPAMNGSRSVWRTNAASAVKFAGDAAYKTNFCLFNTTVNGQTGIFGLCSDAATAFACSRLGGTQIGFDSVFSLYKLPEIRFDIFNIEEIIKQTYAYSRRVLMFCDKQKEKATIGLFCAGVYPPEGFIWNRKHQLYIGTGDVDECAHFVEQNDVAPIRSYVSYLAAEKQETAPPSPPYELASIALFA